MPEHIAYIDEATVTRLMDAAEAVARHTYSPYSRFPVGAALLAADGTIYAGTNVENASYGLTICAERSAVFSAIAAGARDFKVMAIYSPEPTISPCGACRQVMIEFGRDIVVLFRQQGQLVQRTISELVPFDFAFEANSK